MSSANTDEIIIDVGKHQIDNRIETSTTTSSASLDIIGHTLTGAVSNNVSNDIPRYFEEARQSIDIIRTAQENPQLMKQKSAKEVKFIKKSKKKAIDISEHELSVEKVCETYGTSFNQDKPEKSTVSISNIDVFMYWTF